MTDLTSRVRDDAIYATAGILAGVLFGLYGGDAMLEMISLLALAAPDVGVGWAIHLFNSAVFGVAFAEIRRVVDPGEVSRPMLGLLWGIALWVIGPVSGMPILMGNVEAVPNVAGSVGSLWGHVIYGAVLQATGQVGLVLVPVGRRAVAPEGEATS